MTPEPIVHPTHDDPVALAASEGIGGPTGEHHAPHRWWTPVRVALALCAVTLALGLVQKTPCEQRSWDLGNERYAKMCYSDIPYLYTGRGFAELDWPYSDTSGRYQAMEYPVGISYAAYAAAEVTHWLAGSPDLAPRQQVPADQVGELPSVHREINLYVAVTAVMLGAFGLLTTYFLAGASPGRPWDAVAFATAPTLALSGLVNWDLITVACVAGALWAWARGRPVLTGVMIGLGTATKLYPLFLLGAVLVLCLRGRRLRDGATVAGWTAVAWLVMQLPAWATGFDRWTVFWSFNSHRDADLGSLWLLWTQQGHTVSAHTINLVSGLVFVGVCAAVAVLGLRASRTPRMAQLGLLLVLGFLVVNKVYSPQYVLWILPLAVIARPRWRDLLIWQAGEVCYFVAVWFYLGGYTQAAASGAPDPAYTVAILVRVAAELYLAATVVRDLTSGLDPARPVEMGQTPH